jgi:ethanolamine utilization protein EutN
MQLANIIGNATATVKHPTLEGLKLLIAQPLGAAGDADGDPVLIIDQLGCGIGDRVIYTSDGKAVREMVGANNTPVRFAVLGIAD